MIGRTRNDKEAVNRRRQTALRAWKLNRFELYRKSKSNPKFVDKQIAILEAKVR